MKKTITSAISVLSVMTIFPATCFASNLTDWPVAQAQQTVTATPVVNQNITVKGSYVLLADGTVVKPGGTIPAALLPTASFINGTGKNVQFAVIGSPGAYRVATDPEPNWAFEGILAPGQPLPIGSYAYLIAQPGFNCLTMELRSGRDYEYSFFVQ